MLIQFSTIVPRKLKDLALLRSVFELSWIILISYCCDKYILKILQIIEAFVYIANQIRYMKSKSYMIDFHISGIPYFARQ